MAKVCTNAEDPRSGTQCEALTRQHHPIYQNVLPMKEEHSHQIQHQDSTRDENPMSEQSKQALDCEHCQTQGFCLQTNSARVDAKTNHASAESPNCRQHTEYHQTHPETTVWPDYTLQDHYETRQERRRYSNRNPR